MALIKQPVILLGHGARIAGWDCDALLELNIPVLSSWQAADLVDNNHPAYYGRPGVYGHRTANKILYHADRVYSVGCRRSVPCVGHTGLQQEVIVYDEHNPLEAIPRSTNDEWIDTCDLWRRQHPWIEMPTHADVDGKPNSYRVIDTLNRWIRNDEIITTDMGAALVCGFYALKLKPPQRLLTSGGLGEMGCGLPAAVGASFARNKGEVLCLNTDGGMMLNLQELSTVLHHNLPIKMLVFANDGYAMIRGTQDNLGYGHHGVDHKDITLPDFRRLAQSWGIIGADVYTWQQLHDILPQFFGVRAPALVVVHISPKQTFAPKLQPIMVDGKATSPRFDQLSPLR